MRSETLPLFGAAWATPVPQAEPVRVEPPAPTPTSGRAAKKTTPARSSGRKRAAAPAGVERAAAAIAAVMPPDVERAVASSAPAVAAAPVAPAVVAPAALALVPAAEIAAPVAPAVLPPALALVAPAPAIAPLVVPAPAVAVAPVTAAEVRPERGVIVFDVETTGTDRRRDQVIELCVQFGLAEGAIHRTWRIKPDVAISPGAQAVHGISMDELAACPRFVDVIDDIAAVFAAAEVVVGYNLIFDIDMISAEFERVGRPLPDWSSKTVVDPFRLWQQCEPRSLSHAHLRFVGTGFEAAHSAVADVAATGRVLTGMLRTFGLDEHDWRGVAGVCDPARPSWVGPSRHLQWQGERVVMAFGKHSGTPLSQIEKSYLRWMAEKDFPTHVGEICRKAGELPEPEFLAWVRGAYGAPPTA